jgi:hypothetical protein
MTCTPLLCVTSLDFGGPGETPNFSVQCLDLPGHSRQRLAALLTSPSAPSGIVGVYPWRLVLIPAPQ